MTLAITGEQTTTTVGFCCCCLDLISQSIELVYRESVLYLTGAKCKRRLTVGVTVVLLLVLECTDHTAPMAVSAYVGYALSKLLLLLLLHNYNNHLRTRSFCEFVLNNMKSRGNTDVKCDMTAKRIFKSTETRK